MYGVFDEEATNIFIDNFTCATKSNREKQKQRPDKKAICEHLSTSFAVNTGEYQVSTIMESLIDQRILISKNLSNSWADCSPDMSSIWRTSQKQLLDENMQNSSTNKCSKDKNVDRVRVEQYELSRPPWKTRNFLDWKYLWYFKSNF